MSKFVKPEIKVVRFNEADVIVASGAIQNKTMTWSGFGDGQASNAVANYNGQSYTIDSADAITDLLVTLGVKKTAGINNTVSEMSVKKLLETEQSGTGVSSKRWNGNYVYDPDATWNNGTKDIKGVFYKQ